MGENPSSSAGPEILNPARLAPTTMPHSKSLTTRGMGWYGILQYSTVTVLVQYTAVSHGDGI